MMLYFALIAVSAVCAYQTRVVIILGKTVRLQTECLNAGQMALTSCKEWADAQKDLIGELKTTILLHEEIRRRNLDIQKAQDDVIRHLKSERV